MNPSSSRRFVQIVHIWDNPNPSATFNDILHIWTIQSLQQDEIVIDMLVSVQMYKLCRKNPDHIQISAFPWLKNYFIQLGSAMEIEHKSYPIDVPPIF